MTKEEAHSHINLPAYQEKKGETYMIDNNSRILKNTYSPGANL
jgi:hypothetical protein